MCILSKTRCKHLSFVTVLYSTPAFLNTKHDATCVGSEGGDLEFACRWLSTVNHMALKDSGSKAQKQGLRTPATSLKSCRVLKLPVVWW